MLLFGATRLPKLMRSMGEGVKEFRKGVSSLEEGNKKGRGKTRSKAKKA
jgi:TatA/E family protein of Tat protein translocase